MNSDQILARCPGITFRQLDSWCSKGWLKPDRTGTGPGHARTFTGDEARVAIVMGRLVVAGLRPLAAEQVARGRWELAPGILVLVDITPDPERRAIDREILLMTRRIHRSPKVRRILARRAAVKVGAHR